MGSVTFKWEHPAEEVFVTGTFDNWTKSEQLEKLGDVFQKTVALNNVPEKIYYKFVVDGTWTINESDPKEADHEGNVNNFLIPADIIKDTPAAALLNTVTPESTTAKMASEQPVETAIAPDVPAETPASELDKTVSVNPLPAADGAVNPIKLEPGEKIPDIIATENINGHVKLDKESYEKSDAIPGIEATDLPPITSNLIPESSLPVVDDKDVTINTVGVGATTLALAGQVPLEPKAPETVEESQEKAAAEPEVSAAVVEEKQEEVAPEVPAEVKESITESGESPEAAANTTAVEEKKEVEAQLLDEVKPVPPVEEAKVEEPKPEEAKPEEAKEETTTEAPVATETPAPAVPVTEAETTEAATTEVTKTEVPVPEPVTEETKVEETKPEETKPEETVAPATEEAKVEPPVSEEAKVEEIKPEETVAPVTEEAKTEAPAPETAAVETPKADVPVTEAPATEEAKTETAKAEVPAIDTTATEAPKAEIPPAETPVTETDRTEVPPAETPATEAATDTPATEAPKADANGSNGAKAADVSAKKRNRLSSIFSRIKHKLTDKN